MMIKKANITFIIFTYNEEKRIEYPVKCFLPYGEVLVFDNYSTDKTREIVEKLGAKAILINKSNVIFDETEKVVNFVFKHVKTDWVFWGFADDMTPKTCLDLYKKVSQENKFKIVVQKRKTLMFDGKSELDPGFITCKFFRKDSLDFTDNTMHQMGKFKSHVKPADILYLPPLDEFATYHFSRDIMADVIEKINRSSSEQVKTMHGKTSTIRIFLDPLITFIIAYFLYGLFRFGTRGFIVAMRHMMSRYALMAKKYEQDNNLTLVTIEDNFKQEKQKLLSKSPRSNLRQKIWAYVIIFFLSRLHLWYKFGRSNYSSRKTNRHP